MSALISINSPWIGVRVMPVQLKLFYLSSVMFDIITPQEIKTSWPGWAGLRVPWSHGRWHWMGSWLLLCTPENICSSFPCCFGFSRTPHIHTPHKHHPHSSRRGRSSFILIICLIFVQEALLACVLSLSLCIFLRQPFTFPQQEIRSFLWVNCIHG